MTSEANDRPAIPGEPGLASPLQMPAGKGLLPRRAIAVVTAMLVGLPLAVWLDLRHLSEASLRRQARDVGAMIDVMRGYYAGQVVARLQAVPDHPPIRADYQHVEGAIPIPATLSIELGGLIGRSHGNVAYRFVSDQPFRNRAPHALDGFERDALKALRARAANDDAPIFQSTWQGDLNRVRMISPVRMGAACVACHDADPMSPRRNWKVGDVRGIQEVIVSRPLFTDLQSFRFLLIYLGLVAAIGIWFVFQQRRQAQRLAEIHSSLAQSNAFLAGLSRRISRYLSPQVYRSIFSGDTHDSIHTRRKKLSIFFSDIKDFTATTERMQPEELTALLNEYLTAMYAIALRHGGTIDKCVGDALLIFFGDPETRGEGEDARACVRMALEMRESLAHLNHAWRARGVENPFGVRMGIATGYCDVGNFGSDERMDYTIIGVQVNLAARLQSLAEPGQIVISFETYAHTREIVTAKPLPEVTVKGFAQPVIPYAVEGGANATKPVRLSATGFDLYVDPQTVGSDAHAEVRAALHAALDALDRRRAGPRIQPTGPSGDAGTPS